MSEHWQVPGGPLLGIRRWGGSGPQIVMLHGLSSSSAHYEALAPVLVGAGWRVIAPDFRGHGDSDRAPGTYVIEHYAADVEALLESLDAPAVVAGHSLGGAIAVYLAGARPDLVRGAFAEDPPLYHGMPGVMAASGYVPMFESMRDAMRDLQSGDGAMVAIRAMLESMPGPGGGLWIDTVAMSTLDARVESFALADPDVWQPAIDGVALSGWDPLRPVGVPLVILRADPAMGPALTPDEAGAFQRANPDAHIVEIAGSPHGIREHLATTAGYESELLSFLETLR